MYKARFYKKALEKSFKGFFGFFFKLFVEGSGKQGDLLMEIAIVVI